MLRDRSLKARLIGGFALVIAVFAVMSIALVLVVNNISSSAEELNEVYAQAEEQALRAEVALGDLDGELSRVALRDSDLDARRAAYEEARAYLDDRIAELGPLVAGDPEQEALLADFEATLPPLYSAYDEIFTLAEAGDYATAEAVALDGEAVELWGAAAGAADELIRSRAVSIPGS
ncbi:MAG: MCP four helix bundle domain-containing protein [Egibacteraceae bacterium]